MTHPVVNLGSVVTIKGGGTPARKVPDYWHGEIPWATVKDLKSHELGNTQEAITVEGLQNSASNLIPAGTVVTATRMALGRAAITEQNLAINQDLKALFCNEAITPKYLLHFLNANKSKIESMGKGATVKGITLDVLLGLKIPLPPLEEQKRIAHVLDKADAIRKKRKQTIELTEQFLRSAFLDMFGDPITNPKGWPTAIMKDCIADISSGWSAKSEDKVKEPDDWGVLKISAVTSGRFLPSEHKVVSSIEPSRKLIVPKRGDLLFSRANTRELVAATCLVEADSERLFLPDKLWRLTASNDMKPEYLRYLLAHPRYRSYLTRQATGTSGSMLNVSQQKLMGMKLPKPPIEVQQVFSDIVWKTYQLQATSNVSAENMTAQFNGLTQRAFRGEL